MSCYHYDHILTKEDRHYIPAKEYNNCVCCLAYHEGPMTQEKIGKYLGLTKMRISQIEHKALGKLKKM